jgi:hypothetical protein
MRFTSLGRSRHLGQKPVIGPSGSGEDGVTTWELNERFGLKSTLQQRMMADPVVQWPISRR